MATSPRQSPQRRPRRGETPTAQPRTTETFRKAGWLARAESALKAIPAAAPVPVPQQAEPDALDNEDEWEGALPPATDADLAAALSQSLSARPVTEEDADRLWDWVRADPDRGYQFLGEAVTGSKQMRGRLALFGVHLYALDEETADAKSHIGFAGFGPVTDKVAFTHLYLAPDARGRLTHLVPQLLRMAAAEYPGLNFGVATEDATYARMLRPLGFKASFLLTYAPPTPIELPPVVTTEE